jgi:hypothetical protein
MGRNDRDPDQLRNEELHQLRGYRGQESQRKDDEAPLNGATPIVQQRVIRFIDQLAHRIPGGSEYAQQIKNASSAVLSRLEVESGKYAGSVGDFFSRWFRNR